MNHLIFLQKVRQNFGVASSEMVVEIQYLLVKGLRKLAEFSGWIKHVVRAIKAFSSTPIGASKMSWTSFALRFVILCHSGIQEYISQPIIVRSA